MMSLVVCDLLITLFLNIHYFTIFLEIQNVSPSCGSLHGGTVITIQGLGFSDNANNVMVFVGGRYPWKL